jgi:anti-sigma regulatory factor (Ser/Thr protein kinase)
MSFTPDPAHVRTVRMVAVTVARRAGVAAEILDEVRLAIGEACTRAVSVHRRERRSDPIEVAMSLAPAPDGGRPSGSSGKRRGTPAPENGRFTMRVTDRGSPELARNEPSGEDADRNSLDEELIALGVGLALLSGLVADFAVEDAADGAGTEVRMSWPVAASPPPPPLGRRGAARG